MVVHFMVDFWDFGKFSEEAKSAVAPPNFYIFHLN